LWHAVFASELAVNIAYANIDVRSSLGLSLSPSPPNFLLDILRAKHFGAASFSFVSLRRVLYRANLLLVSTLAKPCRAGSEEAENK
jgi:hypothetical protein